MFTTGRFAPRGAGESLRDMKPIQLFPTRPSAARSRVVSRLLRLSLLAALLLIATASTALAAAPVNRSAPTIEGNAVVGETLSTGNGVWQGNPTSFTYQWLRCDAKGAACASIPGATSRTYAVTKTDVGRTVVVLVTAKNADGSTGPVNSQPSDVVADTVAPQSTTPPSIVGRAVVGEQLLADPGTYAPSPKLSYTFQWRSCDAAGTKCADISGATGQSYGVLKANVGNTLRVSVKATNTYGSTTTTSPATKVVTETAAPVTPVSSTLAASASSTICCQKITLSGSVSSNQAGEPITILAKEADDIISYPIDTTTTDASGKWSVKVTPMIATTYSAQTATSRSGSVTIGVHPRVGFGVTGNNFSAKITARDSFGGRIALFQVRNANGTWRTLAPVVIDQQSVAKFHVTLAKGKTYTTRIYLSKAQAGPGYLDGSSAIRRVGGQG